jgi:hypothetical protein
MRVVISIINILGVVLIAPVLQAQSNEDNIIIDNKIENYSYNISSKQVSLVEKSITNYLCLKWPEKIIVAEFYNLFSKIDKVNIKAEKKITPIYEMYKNKNVFYSDVKVCYFELPFFKKGDKASVGFEKTYNDICFFSTIFLSEIQFVKEKTVQIFIPNWMEVVIIEQNFSDNIEKEIITDEKTQTVIYKYIVKNQVGIKIAEDAPAYHKIAPHLLLIPKKATVKKEQIRYFDNYDHVYKWCKEKIDNTSNDTETIARFTHQLIDSCKTDDEKISRIFSWVQNNIRYISFQYGLAGWIPDNAQNVLHKKYGDCKGMSNLLKVMLQSAGFDARMVWIGTNGLSKGIEAPLPLFNHMVCALFKDNQIVYLDPTVKYMLPGEYHNAIQACSTMIEDGESYILDFVPEISPSQNTDSLMCIYKIEGNYLAGTTNMTLSGECKQAILSLIYALDLSRRNSVVKQFLEKGKSQERVSDISIQVEDSKQSQLKINYHEVRTNSVHRIGNKLYINLDSRQDYASNIIDTTKRKIDFVFPYKEYTIREEYLLIPAGFQVISFPAPLNIENNNYKINITYSVEKDRIKYRKEIVIKDVWLKKEHFAIWNADIALLKRNYSEQIILQEIKI